MSNNLAGNYYLANDIDCSSISNFQPIACSGIVHFSGIFDGRNHRISNLTINNMNHWHTGIFCSVVGGEIKNVGVVNANVSGLNNGAVFAANISSSNISNSYVTGNVSSVLSAAGFAVNISNTTITNCYSTAKVSGDGAYVGGLAGNASNSTAINTYWDMEASGQTTSALGEGKTTAEMKKQTTFENWGFDNSLWCIREGITYPNFCSSFSWNLITNCNELQNMRNNLSANYQLANDIDCSSLNFDPIGQSFPNAFSGYFDGKNHTINNLVINYPNYDYVRGLFMITVGATIQNVKLNNVNINGGGRGVGALVGYAHAKTSIYNCSVSGTLKDQATNPYSSSLGGLVGTLDGKSTVNACHSNVNVYGVGASVGGIAGTITEASSVINSYASGTVTGTNNVGGLVGYAYAKAKISNSYSTASVSGKDNVGGLVGVRNDKTEVSSCYATGTVTGNSNVGGLEGYVNGTSTLSSSYAMGTVNGGSNVGGLVGYLYSGSGISDSFSVSSVNGSGSAVGGLVGYARDDAKIS
ncbi:MAG: GLUG motif-containing protein, partial [Alphaproteobacteria bacterium]